MKNKETAKEWFEIAERDLASAEFLQEMRPIPVEIICYHCQQSAEKYLKGVLALAGEEITRTHDLLLLNKKCCAYDNDFEKIENDCLALIDYGVKLRYPFPLEIAESDMRLAIKGAKSVQQFVLERSEKLSM